jgi:hypothetical protein
MRGAKYRRWGRCFLECMNIERDGRVQGLTRDRGQDRKEE